MSELSLMITIVDRQHTRRFIEFYERSSVTKLLATVGRGTAASEILDYFGLEDNEKTILFSVLTGEVWKQVRRGLQSEMQIDVPGTGIAFTIPLSSIGGKKQLQFLTDGQNFVKGEETTLKETKNELLVVVANQG